MALIEVTEQSLRGQAGDVVFEQALVWADKVDGLTADGPLVQATVDGVSVSFRVLPHGIDARCGCALPRPCPHAVADALAWVSTGEEVQLPGLFELLRVQDRDWLAARLAELAAAGPPLAARRLGEGAG